MPLLYGTCRRRNTRARCDQRIAWGSSRHRLRTDPNRAGWRMNQVEVRRAADGDADSVVALWQEAQRWLAAAGTDQWQPRQGDTAQKLLDRVRGNVAATIDR